MVASQGAKSHDPIRVTSQSESPRKLQFDEGDHRVNCSGWARTRFALAAISLMAAGEVSAQDVSGNPNFPIIVTDDQGYADLSAYKHHVKDITTPNMDRLAARGVLFSEAYVTAPVCSPSHAGWNTGQYQHRWDPKSGWRLGLPEGVPNIAHSKPDSVIRDGDWKFLRFYEDGREELYNLKDDIGESKNLIASIPKKATELKINQDVVLKSHDATIRTAVPAKSVRPPGRRKPRSISQPTPKPNLSRLHLIT